VWWKTSGCPLGSLPYAFELPLQRMEHSPARRESGSPLPELYFISPSTAYSGPNIPTDFAPRRIPFAVEMMKPFPLGLEDAIISPMSYLPPSPAERESAVLQNPQSVVFSPWSKVPLSQLVFSRGHSIRIGSSSIPPRARKRCPSRFFCSLPR